VTGRQPYVKEAAINLLYLYVADYSKIGAATDEEKAFYQRPTRDSLVKMFIFIVLPKD